MNTKLYYFYSRYSFLLLTAAILLFISASSFAQKDKQVESFDMPSNVSVSQIQMIKEGPLKKAGTQLAALLAEFIQHEAVNPGTAFTSKNSQVNITNDNVLVDITASGDPLVLEQELEKIGMLVSGVAGPIISGLLPINSIEEVASLDAVNFFRPSMCATSIGATTSQGDAAMYSDVVRTSLSINGSGVIVGVLSDSYDTKTTASTHAADDVTSGDLPGATNPNGYTTPVNVLEDYPNSSDEGRAMLQIVHDVAPGAGLAFATAFTGQAGFANNITALRTTANADVIVDDVFYYYEPMFQDGIIAQAVDAAYSAGVPYFSSAGNQGQKSYESVWRAAPGVTILGTPYISTFDFDPGAGVDNLQDFTIGAGQTISIVLQWDSPFASVCTGCPGSQNDIDFFIMNTTGTTVYASGGNDNIDGDAVEFISVTNNGASAFPIAIMIAKYAGDDPGFIKYINYGSTQGSLEYATNSSTLKGHCNATGAIAVAAAPYFNTPAFGVAPPLLESFSSWGPTAIRFATDGSPTSDARAEKPEITAPDGVNTTFFSTDIANDADTYPNFFGTSAAAPHAAAIAALMLEANSSLTPAQIYANMKAGAVDMGTSGFDNGSGYGLINASLISPLPVELSSFTAKVLQSGGIKLDWRTETEVANYGFDIERKSKNNQLEEWTKIGFVSGGGNLNSPKDYTFEDKNINYGTFFYRLKQIDNDGSYSYSDIVKVEALTVNDFAVYQNYPNPFNPITAIKFNTPSDSKVKITITNSLGEEIETLLNGDQNPGIHEVVWDGSKCASGIYFADLRINAIDGKASFNKTIKMILNK